MIELHYYPGNASFAPHVLLRELGVPFELKRVDRETNAHKGAAYRALNPSGRIPVLVDGDLVLFETAAICLHLVDMHPDAGLAPAIGTQARAHFYKWLIYMTNTVQPEVLMYYYSDRYTEDPACAGAVKAAATRRLGEWFAILEDALGETDGPWFMGAQYTVLDIYLTMLARWGRFLPAPPRDMARIGALARRVLARPAVAEAIAAEGIEGDFLSP